MFIGLILKWWVMQEPRQHSQRTALSFKCGLRCHPDSGYDLLFRSKQTNGIFPTLGEQTIRLCGRFLWHHHAPSSQQSRCNAQRLIALDHACELSRPRMLNMMSAAYRPPIKRWLRRSHLFRQTGVANSRPKHCRWFWGDRPERRRVQSVADLLVMPGCCLCHWHWWSRYYYAYSINLKQVHFALRQPAAAGKIAALIQRNFLPAGLDRPSTAAITPAGAKFACGTFGTHGGQRARRCQDQPDYCSGWQIGQLAVAEVNFSRGSTGKIFNAANRGGQLQIRRSDWCC